MIFALKNPTASAGFEPANLGTKGQHATPRPIIIKKWYMYIPFLNYDFHLITKDMVAQVHHTFSFPDRLQFAVANESV